MFEKIGEFAYKWCAENNPWTNVYGLARTIIASSTALTLALNDTTTFFKPGAGVNTFPNCSENFSIFCTVPNEYMYLSLIKWLCVILLIVVASGWRPRITGVIHWWISYSVQVAAMTTDGGEQVAAVLTLLLIPITLTDSRKWHWNAEESSLVSSTDYYKRLIALVTIWVIRFQMAILYLNSTIAKLAEDDWINGTAVYYYIQDPMLGLPKFLLNILHPVISSSLIILPTWGTIILQFLLFAAFLAPKKIWKNILVAAILMHEVFALMLGLISFSMIMIGALILYLRPSEQAFSFKGVKKFKRRNKISVPIYEKSKGA